MAVGPVMETAGLGKTVSVFVGNEAQPVADSVNVKFTVPWLIPVITPLLFIVAMAGFDELHVPPVAGDAVVVLPTHTIFD